jgi:hypothetical protein
MILAQIDAFFQLYHSLEFDLIINLSIKHYPIMSTPAIIKTLSVHEINKKYQNISLFVMEGDKHPERLTTPFMEYTKSISRFVKDCFRQWPFEFEPFKHSQWMVLSKDFVHELIYDLNLRLLLAYSQHTGIPVRCFS